MAARHIGSIGWRTVVSGGSVKLIRAESSKPTTDTSSGHGQARPAGGPDGAQGHRVAGTHDSGDAGIEQSRRGGLGTLERVERVGDLVEPELDPGPRGHGPGSDELAVGRLVVGGTDEHPDPGVTERQQVAHRLLDGDGVVARDARKVEVPDRGVDQDGRQPALGQPGVVLVGCVGLGVQATHEDDARDLLLKQEVDVVRLGHSTAGLGAQDRREAALGKHDAHHLRERREDRVLELRQDQSHEPRPLAAQLRRPFVAQDIERREHGLAR